MTATSRKKWLPILILVVLVAGAGVAGNLLRRSSMTDLDDQDGYSDGEDYGESDAGDYADAGDYEEGKDSGRSGARGGAGPAYDSARAGAAASRPSSGGTRQGNAARSTMRQGPCFRYLVPEGWRVVEDGQYAVVLMAPDQRAITTMVGNVGLPSNYNPQQYLYERLSQAGLGNLRFGPGRQAPAVFGFPTAYEFDVDYVVSGIPCRGLARCSVSPSYDFCTMVMTWAAAENSQWPSYSSWLPDLAGQVQVTNSAAFGASGIAAQNLQNSVALGEQARQYREESAANWNQATNERWESQDRNNAAFRENLGAVQSYYDPYENRSVELPTSNTVYWINPTTGRIVGDPNPSFDPRTPTDSDWQPMNLARP